MLASIWRHAEDVRYLSDAELDFPHHQPVRCSALHRLIYVLTVEYSPEAKGCVRIGYGE